MAIRKTTCYGIIYWVGSKRDYVPLMLPLIPKHRVYVEPFVGSGALFLAKEPAELAVLNDNNTIIYRLWKKVLDGDLDVRPKISEEEWKALKAKFKGKNPHQMNDVWDVFYWLMCSWGGLGSSFVSRYSSTKGFCGIGKWLSFCYSYWVPKLRKQKVILRFGDFYPVVQEWDEPDAFIYLDPPYVGADPESRVSYKVSEAIFNRCIQFMSRAKALVMMSSYAYPDIIGKLPDHITVVVMPNMRRLRRRRDLVQQKPGEALFLNYRIKEVPEGCQIVKSP